MRKERGASVYIRVDQIHVVIPSTQLQMYGVWAVRQDGS